MSDNEKRPEWLTENADGSLTIELAGKGMTVSGAPVTSVTMREPTVDDELTVQEMSASGAQKELHLFANLCEVAPDDVRSLSMRNYRRLQRGYSGFMD